MKWDGIIITNPPFTKTKNGAGIRNKATTLYDKFI